MIFEKVLIPTDFSEYAQKTLECIGDIPGVKEVLLLHVVDTAHISKKGLVQDLYIQDAKMHLNEQKKHLENIGLKVKAKIEVITGSDKTGYLYRSDLDESPDNNFYTYHIEELVIQGKTRLIRV